MDEGIINVPEDLINAFEEWRKKRIIVLLYLPLLNFERLDLILCVQGEEGGFKKPLALFYFVFLCFLLLCVGLCACYGLCSDVGSDRA